MKGILGAESCLDEANYSTYIKVMWEIYLSGKDKSANTLDLPIALIQTCRDTSF